MAAEVVGVLDSIDAGSRPKVASIIGTITFSDDEQYKIFDEFRREIACRGVRERFFGRGGW